MELPTFLTRHKYGEIRLTGHRIGLLHVIERYNQGETAAAIAEYFPSVPLELIEKSPVLSVEVQPGLKHHEVGEFVERFRVAPQKRRRS